MMQKRKPKRRFLERPQSMLAYLAAVRLWRNVDRWRLDMKGVFYDHNRRRKRLTSCK